MSFDFREYIKLLDEKKLDEALEYRKMHTPQKLYKYISLSDLHTCSKNNQLCEVNTELNELKFKTLNNNEIWTSRFRSLNDPYEYKSVYLNSDELVKHGWPVEYLEEYLEKIKNIYLICSFSGNLVDCMPMWAHYANNHRGFCVEYDVLNPKVVYKISYEEERVGIASIIASIFNLTDKLRKGEIDETDTELQFYMTLLTHFATIKHTSWSYENEYRVLHADFGGTSPGATVSSFEVGLCPSKIYVGSQCSTEHRSRLIEIAQNIHVNIYEMFLDEKVNEYELSYRPL